MYFNKPKMFERDPITIEMLMAHPKTKSFLVTLARDKSRMGIDDWNEVCRGIELRGTAIDVELADFLREMNPIKVLKMVRNANS